MISMCYARFLGSCSYDTIFCFSVVEVSFEETGYSIMEPDGPVETCVVLNCEAAAPVTVVIAARESQPPQARGIYMLYHRARINNVIFLDEEDFRADRATVVFAPGETRMCESFGIVNDDVTENREEVFTVVIEEVSPSSVLGVNSQATVTIIDDDGKFDGRSENFGLCSYSCWPG